MINKTFKRTVLIVDDDEINREILVSILSSNYNVIAKSNGKEALDILDKHPGNISLILLDLQMPVMDGYEFLEIATKNEKFNSIPIIVETAELKDEEKALLAGASDYVTKPYSPTVILSRVKALIRLSESASALKESRLDPETGLYSRSYFGYLYKKTMDALYENEFDFILFRIRDVDSLTSIYGEDGFAKEAEFIGQLLLDLKDRNNLYCRVSPTMFSVLKPHNKENSIELINKINKLLQTNPPFNKINYDFAFECKVDHEISFSVLVNRMLAALKTLGDNVDKNVVEFEPEMLEADSKKAFITSIMEESLKNNDFLVYYQPKHDTSSEELKGFEALVRWKNPTAGIISPGDFIPIFEANGFITKLDLYMLEKVLQDLNKIKELGLKQYPVSINLSRRDLATVNINAQILPLFKKYKVNKSLIHFEITESMCGSSQDVISAAKTIKNAGFAIEIDDFGSGYSSLGIIDTIPMDYLKLDITFARNIEAKKVVVRTVIELAHALKVKTVAEGVESKEQLKIYKDFGCDLIQGYYFSKPMCYEEYVDYLRKNEK